MDILARVLGFSKPEAQQVTVDSNSVSSSSAATRQQQEDGGIRILKRLLKDDSDDSGCDECPSAREESIKKYRGSDAEFWAGNCSADAITAALAGKCCENLCTQNYLTVGGVRRFRIANANRSIAERRVFARLLVRSMVQASENVTLSLILFLSHRFASVNIPSYLQEKKRKVNYVLSDGTKCCQVAFGVEQGFNPRFVRRAAAREWGGVDEDSTGHGGKRVANMRMRSSDEHRDYTSVPRMHASAWFAFEKETHAEEQPNEAGGGVFQIDRIELTEYYSEFKMDMEDSLLLQGHDIASFSVWKQV